MSRQQKTDQQSPRREPQPDALTLDKDTMKDIDARPNAADQVRGGAPGASKACGGN